MNPLKGTVWDSRNCLPPSATILLDFTARSYKDFFLGTETLIWGQGPGMRLGPLASHGDSPQLRYPSDFSPPLVGIRTACSAFLPFLPVSVWLLLYILSCKTSIQLDFKRFQMMIALSFSCNFDVVVEG